MILSSFSNRYQSPLYYKSLEIFQLAQHISNYLSDDLSPLKSNGEENQEVYLTGDIVQQSFSIGPHILKAEKQPFQDEKHRHVISALLLSNKLYRSCKKLEHVNSNGKEYLPIILKEIKRFRKSLHQWLTAL